jgi:hypothetical protein
MDFLTTEEQLQQCVPYVEVNDNAVNYKSFLPSTGAIAPMPFAGNARVRLFDTEGTTELYRTPWNNLSFNKGGTIDGSIPLPVKDTEGNDVTKDDIGLIVVQTRPEGDNTLRYIYRWIFIIQDDTVSPPDRSEFNTRPSVSLPSDRKKVDITVRAMDDSPTLPDVWYKVWLEKNNSTTTQSAINAFVALDSDYIGPFGAKSQKKGNDATLEIDVNNLLNVDGSQSSEKITAGSYNIIYEYSDSETGIAYAGVTAEPVSLAGTDNTSSDTSSGGSGGCNGGYGLFGLLLTGLVTHKYRKV